MSIQQTPPGRHLVSGLVEHRFGSVEVVPHDLGRCDGVDSAGFSQPDTGAGSTRRAPCVGEHTGAGPPKRAEHGRPSPLRPPRVNASQGAESDRVAGGGVAEKVRCDQVSGTGADQSGGDRWR